jgi:hypothetical protein
MDDATIGDGLTLEIVQRRFEAWRASRTKRGPIPDSLWEAAVKLCERYPITHVCRSLRLSFTALKRRLCRSNDEPVQFMEIDLSGCNVQAAGTGYFSSAWHMECERPDGARLRFSGNGQVPPIDHLLVRFLS